MNFKRYIGIPYKENGRDFGGVDCFGICYLIYREECKLNLYNFTDSVEYNVCMPNESHKEIHKKIPKILTVFEEVPLTPLKLFDGILFYESAKKDIVNHMGIYIGDNSFIHSVVGRESMVSRLSNFYKNRMYKVLRRRKDINV